MVSSGALERFSQLYSERISAVSDVVPAFGRCEQGERTRDEFEDMVEAARTEGPQKGFELREGEFNGIEIGTVGRQKPQARADAFTGGLHLRLLVHREVIEHDDLARPQRGDEHLLDVREKGGIVDRSVKHGWRREAVDAERGDDRLRLPVPARRVIAEAQAARAAAIATQQIGRDPRFVDEDVAARIVQRQGVLPSSPRRRDVRSPLFVGVYRFF